MKIQIPETWEGKGHKLYFIQEANYYLNKLRESLSCFKQRNPEEPDITNFYGCLKLILEDHSNGQLNIMIRNLVVDHLQEQHDELKEELFKLLK